MLPGWRLRVGSAAPLLAFFRLHAKNQGCTGLTRRYAAIQCQGRNNRWSTRRV
jgi:hypothetical protein